MKNNLIYPEVLQVKNLFVSMTVDFIYIYIKKFGHHKNKNYMVSRVFISTLILALMERY